MNTQHPWTFNLHHFQLVTIVKNYMKHKQCIKKHQDFKLWHVQVINYEHTQMARSVICIGYLQTHSLFWCITWLISINFKRLKTRHWVKWSLARYGRKQTQVTDLWSFNSASTSFKDLTFRRQSHENHTLKSLWMWTFVHVSFKLVNMYILKQSHIFWMPSVIRVLVTHLQPQYGNSAVGDLCYCSLFLFFQLVLLRYCSMIIYYPSFCQVDQPPVLLHAMPLDCVLPNMLHALSFLSTPKIFPWVQWLGNVIDHPPQSNAKAKQGVVIYLCSISGHSWHVLGWTFTTYKFSAAITFSNDVTFSNYVSQCSCFNVFS